MQTWWWRRTSLIMLWSITQHGVTSEEKYLLCKAATYGNTRATSAASKAADNNGWVEIRHQQVVAVIGHGCRAQLLCDFLSQAMVSFVRTHMYVLSTYSSTMACTCARHINQCPSHGELRDTQLQRLDLHAQWRTRWLLIHNIHTYVRTYVTARMKVCRSCMLCMCLRAQLP